MPAQAKGKLKRKPVAKAKAKAKSVFKEASWMAVGFDIQMAAVAAAAFAYDATLKKDLGPVAVIQRFSKDVHWFERMKYAARPEVYIHDLMAKLKILCDIDEIYIALEEPWAVGQVRGGISNALRQQAQMSGAVMSGLLRYGFNQLHEISANDWRQIVAAELGITIHHTKWNPPPEKYEGRFRPKQYVQRVYPEVPDWPDLIERKNGLIPKPEDSHAKIKQVDDRYQAICVADWMVLEIEDS